MENYYTEGRFSQYVYNFFSEKLKSNNLDEYIEIKSKINILRDITIGYEEKKKAFKLYFGFQEQDIIFCPKDYKKYIPISKENPFFAYHWLQRGMNSIIVPLLICELKIPESMNTHQFITYSKICEQIKEVFPYCDYYFLLASNKKRKLMPETVLRQGKSFDRIFLNFLESEDEKEKCWKSIYDHLMYLKTELRIFD